MTSWWNKNVETRMDDFKSWIGSFDKESKKMIRSHVINKKYKSILDCGSGLCSEYYGYKNDNYKIKYTGLDSCEKLVEINCNNGINVIKTDLEEKINIEDNSYDCVFCKDVLEHLSDYKLMLLEMIRIAKKEVIVGWFIKPISEETKINYWEEEDLYHNEYNINEIEDLLKSNNKVSNFEWKNVDDKEINLHIYIK